MPPAACWRCTFCPGTHEAHSVQSSWVQDGGDDDSDMQKNYSRLLAPDVLDKDMMLRLMQRYIAVKTMMYV
jgi:hypothetical protein